MTADNRQRGNALHRFKPVVDKVFELADAPAAFDAMDSGDFFGKVVIRL
jgi:NADPH:quinone reductase-like Zn-dependent oxidoreductase